MEFKNRAYGRLLKGEKVKLNLENGSSAIGY
jgi:hypothetical protein